MRTDKMMSDLLECKSNAMLLTKSDDPPRTETGRKKGYMAVMKGLWRTKFIKPESARSGKRG